MCHLCDRNDTNSSSRFTDNCHCIYSNRSWVEAMTVFWIATLGTSATAFLLKYSVTLYQNAGFHHPKIQKINALIPIALLSALVARAKLF
jgi:hypothetical protein